MEFGFDVGNALRSVAQSTEQNEIAVIHGDKIRPVNAQLSDQVRQVIDAMGHASAKVSNAVLLLLESHLHQKATLCGNRLVRRAVLKIDYQPALQGVSINH